MDAGQHSGIWYYGFGADEGSEPLTFSLVKRHKKIVIVDNYDQLVYCPPQWIKLNSRYDMQGLVDDFNRNGRNIRAIMQFESDFHPDKRFKSQK